MTLLKKLSIVNVSGVLGAVLSFFILPESTRFWLWFGSVVVVLCSLNLLVLSEHRRTLAGEPVSSKAGSASLVISLILICIALAIQFAFR